MSAASYDITIEQGADYGLGLHVKNPDGSNYDLTGATITADIRKDWQYPVIASFGVTITNASGGLISIALPASINKTIDVMSGKYDVLMLKGGVKIRLMQGNITISPYITHG
jgi:hypothetical protein